MYGTAFALSHTLYVDHAYQPSLFWVRSRSGTSPATPSCAWRDQQARLWIPPLTALCCDTRSWASNSSSAAMGRAPLCRDILSLAFDRLFRAM